MLGTNLFFVFWIYIVVSIYFKMRIYNKYILPKLIHFACSQRPSYIQRQKVVPFAQGQVLEIGIGSGLNLPFYNSHLVERLTGIDPSQELWQSNPLDPKSLDFVVEHVIGTAESLPFDNTSYDTVLLTYTLCSIQDTTSAFDEIRRVLKPNGRLVFSEHGKAPDPLVARWQNLLNPVWKRLGGGCNLNRDIPDIINSNGFNFDQLEANYIPGWKPASFNYWGIARLH